MLPHSGYVLEEEGSRPGRLTQTPIILPGIFPADSDHANTGLNFS